MVEHVLLEIKTGQDSEKKADSAMQLFSALPTLRNQLWQRLIGRDERLSFEISLEDQLIKFYIFVPARLEEYLKSLILANYPQAIVSKPNLERHPEEDPTYKYSPTQNHPANYQRGAIGFDFTPPQPSNQPSNPPQPPTSAQPLVAPLNQAPAPISTSVPTPTPTPTSAPAAPSQVVVPAPASTTPPNPTPSSHLIAGYLVLRHQEYLPLKDYREFGDADSLSPVLSVFSKAKKGEHAIVQLVIKDNGDAWKAKAPGPSSETEETESTRAAQGTQKALVLAKIREKGLDSTIRVAVLTPNEPQSQLLMESIIHAYRNTSKEISNYLLLKTPWVSYPRRFGDKVHRPLPLATSEQIARDLRRRHFSFWNHFHLSVYEAATIWHLPDVTLSTIPNISWGKNLLGEPPEKLPIVKHDFAPEIKKEINVFAQTVYKNEMVSYGIWRADRRRHMYIIGKTGTGKSTLLTNMAINDLRNNEGLCFIDPHGDAVETLLDYIPSHRINDVVYFNPADANRTVQINVFEAKNIAHRELIASGIVDIFKKLYGDSWGPRLEHFLRNALLTLLQSENARLSDIIDLFTNKKFRDQIVGELQDPVLRNFWEGEFNPLLDRQRQESIAPILNKVGQFVSSPLVRNVVNSSKSSFSIEDLMDQGKILLVNLSQGLLGEDNATLLGAMMITKIQLAAMGRVHIPEEQRRDFYLYVDEFQNFATGAFTKILSEARKYRLSLILANQYIAQIDEDVRKAIFGNCGNMASFVMGSEDAEIFSKEYSDRYTPRDLVELNKHQIINRVTIDNVISQPFSGFTLSPPKNSNNNREKVIKVSRERYAAAPETREVELPPYVPPAENANEPFWMKAKKKKAEAKEKAVTQTPEGTSSPVANNTAPSTNTSPQNQQAQKLTSDISPLPSNSSSSFQTTSSASPSKSAFAPKRKKEYTPEQLAAIEKANRSNPNHPSYVPPEKRS